MENYRVMMLHVHTAKERRIAMPIQIVRNDITVMKTDAIVNAANESLLGGGGVDGAIHRAAGPGMLEECRGLGGCRTGDAKITRGYRLPCRYVIHTVGPVWMGGHRGEKELLASCYRNSLCLAAEHGCETVAFPLISAGAYGYPREQAMRIAMETIRSFLNEREMLVYLVVFDHDSVFIGEELYGEISRYIDDKYAVRFGNVRRGSNYFGAPCAPATKRMEESRPEIRCSSAIWGDEAESESVSLEDDLKRRLAIPDESFSQMVLRKISEKGITDAACYKKANLDRKLFSKIRSDVHYKPSKRTAVALMLSLELPPPEAEELLKKAGYALSPSNTFDRIIEYFLQRGVYDVFVINEALFSFDQVLLGA